MGKDILGIFGKRLRYFILSGKYLLVEFGGLGILEGEASTQHSVEYDSTTPNIDHYCFVTVLPFDHLRGSIARRPACRLQPLVFITTVVPLRYVLLNPKSTRRIDRL